MKRQIYEDYKYVMMDTGSLYIGAKYTYGELVENDQVPFKFATLTERYIIPDVGPDTTLESHLYYMKPEEFSCRTLMQLKAKVKISRLVLKKSLFGRQKKIYSTEVIPLQEFVKSTPEEKKSAGIFIQELVISKLGLMTFMV